MPNLKVNPRQNCVRKIYVQSPLRSEDVIAHISCAQDQDKGHTFKNKQEGSFSVAIIDSSISHDLPIFQEIRRKGSILEFVLCLKNKDFYKMDFVGILQYQLKKISCNSSSMDRIVTASQEAFSNAFFWSSLDLTPIKGIRSYDFYDQVEEKLKNPIFSDRVLTAYLARSGEIVEVGFHVHGAPIHWPNREGVANFRGTAIMASHADHIEIAPDRKAITLYFKN